MRTSALFEENTALAGRLDAVALLPGNGGILRRRLKAPPED